MAKSATSGLVSRGPFGRVAWLTGGNRQWLSFNQPKPAAAAELSASRRDRRRAERFETQRFLQRIGVYCHSVRPDPIQGSAADYALNAARIRSRGRRARVVPGVGSIVVHHRRRDSRGWWVRRTLAAGRIGAVTSQARVSFAPASSPERDARSKDTGHAGSSVGSSRLEAIQVSNEKS